MTENRFTPFVSIIVPCYNCEQYVEETLASLLAQTYKAFEVICVNDGSKDRTGSILETWTESGLNIQVIHQENGGVSSARNNGIAKAKGKYLLFLDSDDIYHPELIQTLVSLGETHSADTVYCGLTRDLSSLLKENVLDAVVEVQGQEAAMSKMMMDMPRFGFYCYLYKTDIVKEFNLGYPVNVKHGEDREFLWEYLCHCRRAVFVDRNLYGYRINESSVTHGTATWGRTERMAGLDRISAHFEQYGCPFLETFRSYMYPRTAWSIAKVFATQRKRQLFLRLADEYNMKSYMKSTLKDHNKLVALSSLLYLIHKDLFYYALSLSAGMKVFS